MPAVLNIGCHHFFFASTTNAAKVADLLNKSVPVEHNFGRGREPNTYNTRPADSYEIGIELKMTKQRKPKSPYKALPEQTHPNNEYHQK